MIDTGLGNAESGANTRVKRLFGSSGSLRRELIRGGVGSFGVKIATAAIGTVLAILLARTLGPADYGIYAFSLAVVSVISIPAAMGLPTLVLRETARAEAAGAWGRLLGLWRWSTMAAGLMSALAAVAVLTFIWLQPEEWGWAKKATLLLGGALVPLMALGNLRGAALRGLRHVVLGQLPEGTIRPLLLLCFVVAVIMLPMHKLSPQNVMGLHVVAAMLAFLFGAVLLYRYQAPQMRGSIPEYDSKAWMVSVLPLALLGGVQVINQQTDIVMLGLMRSDVEVGIYRVVTQVAVLVTFGLNAVAMTMMPHVARMIAPGERLRLQRLATAGARASFAFATIAFLVVVLFGAWLIEVVFGPAFAQGYAALVIIGIGQLVNAAFGPVGAILNMTGHERITLYAVGTAAIANVGFNLVLIPPFGLQGAAIATAATLVLWNIVLWWFALRQLGINTFVLNLAAGGTRK